MNYVSEKTLDDFKIYPNSNIFECILQYVKKTGKYDLYINSSVYIKCVYSKLKLMQYHEEINFIRNKDNRPSFSFHAINIIALNSDEAAKYEILL